MFKEISILTKLNLCNLYGLNVFRKTKDKGQRKKSIALMVAIALVIATVVAYIGGMAYGYIYLGLGQLVPAYMITIASLIILFMGIFKAGPVIFENKGYDILCALPVSQASIVISRFIRMYVENLMFSLLVMIPGIAVYGFLVKPGVVFYLGGILATFVLPLAPMTIAIIVGTIITAVSSRMKHQSIVGAALSVLLVVGIMILSSNFASVGEEITVDMIRNYADFVIDLLEKTYIPAVWLGDMMLYGRFGPALLFTFGMLLILTGAIMVIGANLKTITQNLYGSVAKHDFEMGSQQQSKVIVALYKKEFKRYFASNVYVTNTIIGPILGTIMTGALLFVGMDSITNAMESLPMEIDIIGLAPLLLGGVFCVMTITSTSISMEGREWWILKSLPVSTKDILDGKLLMNLILMTPFYVVSEILMVIALKPSGLDLLWIILFPALLIVFSCIWGLFVNLKLPVFNWENEVTVVKQSMAALVGGMGGMVVAIVCALMLLLIPYMYNWLCKLLICITLIIVSRILYVKNNRVNLEEL